MPKIRKKINTELNGGSFVQGEGDKTAVICDYGNNNEKQLVFIVAEAPPCPVILRYH